MAGPGRDDRKPGEWVEVMAEHHPARQEGSRKRARSTREKAGGRAGAWNSARNECRNKAVFVETPLLTLTPKFFPVEKITVRS